MKYSTIIATFCTLATAVMSADSSSVTVVTFLSEVEQTLFSTSTSKTCYPATTYDTESGEVFTIYNTCNTNWTQPTTTVHVTQKSTNVETEVVTSYVD